MKQDENKAKPEEQSREGGKFRLALILGPVVIVAFFGAFAAVFLLGGSSSATAGADRAPDFSLTTLDGEEFNMADKRGKVVALFVMAGWCPTCIPESQAWDRLYPAYKDEGLELLMVSADANDTAQTYASFRRAASISPLPFAVDREGGVLRDYEVQALDTTVIIDREGNIVYRDAVPTDYETLKREIEEVL